MTTVFVTSTNQQHTVYNLRNFRSNSFKAVHELNLAVCLLRTDNSQGGLQVTQKSILHSTHGTSTQINSPALCLLLVVVFAVKFPFSEVTAGGERLLTHGALQTLLVPRRIVDAHQEAVGDGPLASFTHGGVVAFRP